MSLDYGQGPSSATNITLDLRLLNPFAEDVASGQDEPLTDDMSTRSSTLRRGSLDKDAPNTPNVLREHVKSRTELDVYTGSNSLHPLRSAGLAPGPNDAGVTRPHLSRVLNVGALVDAPPVTVNRNPAFPVETDVLVHQVRDGFRPCVSC
ncbi:hypothetical protein H0H87_004276 [Tephrocybe sp. NHM501043]|nr:hypothetical protein H0H87_004276 [Tephrocybe sp. NHM501043]